MRYRSFAKTDWQVSEIGFGAWQLGGSWGTVDDRESIRTLHDAFEKGVNFVDTAELYGNGHSEAVIGEALRQWRGGRIYVATKVQPIAWPDASEDGPAMRGRYPAWHLRQAVETSLRRLGVERIDLFQLHCWVADGSQALDWLETLNALRQDGKVDQIGVSIRDYRPEDGVDIARFGLVNAIQVIFNMFEQVAGDVLLPAAAKSSTAVIARVPLDSGSLAGHWSEDSYADMEPGSVPHTLFRGARFGDTLARVRALKALCAPYYPTLAEAAMRYVLSHPAVTTLIPGMKTIAEVDMNVSCSDGAPFPDALAAALPAHAFHRAPDFYKGA